MLNLTKREAEIVNLLMEGKTNKEIADILYLSVHTVKSNLEKIYEKYNIHNRVLLSVFIKEQEIAIIKNRYLN